MDEFVVYDFKMDAWTPQTLPLKRLSDYAGELAKLFGSGADVHLMKIRKGSAIKEIAVARTAHTGVAQRLALIGSPDAPDDLLSAYQKLNQLLRLDGGSAVLKLKGGAKVIDFPGCKTSLAEEAVVHEVGSLDGVIIRVGGKDETVPVWLEGENQERLPCNATRSIAKELAAHLFGNTVRVHGAAKWRRNGEGRWDLDEFNIKSWEALDDTSLIDVVTKLRELPGNGWAELDDPQAEWQRIRGHN